jgi:hypothetical protein
MFQFVYYRCWKLKVTKNFNWKFVKFISFHFPCDYLMLSFTKIIDTIQCAYDKLSYTCHSYFLYIPQRKNKPQILIWVVALTWFSFFHLIMHKTNKACILECIRHNRKIYNIYCHNIYFRFFGPGFGAHTVGLARDNSCIFTVSQYLVTIFTKGLPLAILHHGIYLLTALFSQYPQGSNCYVQYHIIFCRLFTFLMILIEKIYDSACRL